MEHYEHQSNVAVVQARYHYLGLTFEQAEQVLKYETIRDTFPSKHILSIWEQLDYERAAFYGFLNEAQMAQYEERMSPLHAVYIEDLVKQDNENAKWVDQKRAKIDYLKNSLIPALSDQPSPVFPPAFAEDRNKIDYLKACYKTFLHERQKEALVNHVRLNKTFAPNGWKQALLSHYTYCLLPDYWAFEIAMDAPTKSVAQYIKERLYQQNPEVEAFQNEKLKELKKFDCLNYEKFYQATDGWSVWTRQPFSEEEEKVHWAMSLLLLDRNAYGFEDIG